MGRAGRSTTSSRLARSAARDPAFHRLWRLGVTSLAIEAAANFPQAPWGRDVHDALPSELGLGSLFRALRRSISRSRSRVSQVDRHVARTDESGLGLVAMIGATVSGGSLGVEWNGEIDRVESGGRTGHYAPCSTAFGAGFEARRMGTSEGLSCRVSYPPTGWGKTARKLLGMTVKFRMASIAAKALLRSLPAHCPFADQANCSVILFKAPGAAEGVARLVGLALELGATTRVAAVTADVGWEIGRQIHDVRLSKRGRRLATARLPWCWVSCCRGW